MCGDPPQLNLQSLALTVSAVDSLSQNAETSDKLTVRWLLVGGFVAAVFGFMGYRSARDDSVVYGLIVGAGAVALLAAAWWLWRRQESDLPAPAAEYVVAVWAITYVILVAIIAGQRSISLVDSFLLLPPVSFLPLVVRVALRDDGEPFGRARSAAYRLHQAIGWALLALGALFIVSLFFIVVAPLPLVRV